MKELLFKFLQNNEGVLIGALMAGVILILVGVQNVTRADLKKYIASKRKFHKIDAVVAWGLFYIIFGTLISVSAILTISIYFPR